MWCVLRLARKEEFSVIIVGLDGAGKTVRSLNNRLVPRLTRAADLAREDKDIVQRCARSDTRQDSSNGWAEQRVNYLQSLAVADTLLVGKITLPSTILKFWDLGGQKGIRTIWPKYYDDCHAVVYVIDAEDRERLGEGWEVFGTSILPRLAPLQLTDRKGRKDSVLSNPQILNVPLLLLANKQDSPQSLSVDEIRRDYEEWFQNKIENSRRTYEYDSSSDMHHRRERIASLDVMGVSALEGCVSGMFLVFFNELTGAYRTGVRAAIDWIFIRVQNSRS